MKTSVYVLLNRVVISVMSRSSLSLLDWTIVNVFPNIMRNRAVRSYFHMNFSPKRQIEKQALVTIAVAELLANRTKSANGNTTRRSS